MAGFEVVVRPVVLPNIRPAPPRVLVPLNDPTQGLAVISGSGGKCIDLQHNWNVSVTRQRPHQESRRQYDKEKVYQVDKKTGKKNQDNYVEVERLKRVRLETTQGPVKVLYNSPPKLDNVETLETDVTR